MSYLVQHSLKDCLSFVYVFGDLSMSQSVCLFRFLCREIPVYIGNGKKQDILDRNLIDISVNTNCEIDHLITKLETDMQPITIFVFARNLFNDIFSVKRKTILETTGVPVTGYPPIYEFIND